MSLRSPPSPAGTLALSSAGRRRLLLALVVSGACHGLLLLLPHTARVATPASAMHVTLRPSAFDLRAPPLAPRPVTETIADAAAPSRIESPVEAPSAHIETAAGPTTAATELPLPAVTYYRPDQLTRPPHIDLPPELNPPELASAYGSGRIVLQLWINERGHVVDTVVEKTELPELFSHVTTSAFRLARFHPGELNGVSVRAIMRVEVDFERAAETVIVQPAAVVAATL